MPFTDSQRKQFASVVPTDPTTPTVPAHLQDIVDAIEAQTVLRADDWSDADTFIAPYSDGMLLYVVDIASLFLRLGGAWTKVYPKTYTGTALPVGGLGVGAADGDLYFQTS